MIYIVIGQSGSGKTTFVKKNFINGKTEIQKEYTFYTKSNDIYALGKYGIGTRTEGTDTLPYNAKDSIKKQLKKFVQTGKNVVIEGDRINNKNIFDYIAALGVDVKLYLVVCSIGTSMERLRSAGSTITPKFVKTTKTKSKKMFLDYAKRFNGEVIKTEEK